MFATFEKIIIYISLVAGTLVALLTKGGADYFLAGDIPQGLFSSAVTILTAATWSAPLLKRYRAVGLNAGRGLVIMLLFANIYGIVREIFAPNLPKLWP